MKVAKQTSLKKVNKPIDLKNKTYPSVIPKLKKDDVSSVLHVTDTSDIKQVYHNLTDLCQHYIDILISDEENGEFKETYSTLISNILLIESKLISIEKRRCYEKLKSKEVFRDVTKKMKAMEKLAGETDRLRTLIYNHEQVWNSKLKEINKRDRKNIMALAQNNMEKVDDLFVSISTKWSIYKKMYNAMEYVNENVSLKRRKNVTVDVLKEIMRMQEQDMINNLSVS